MQLNKPFKLVCFVFPVEVPGELNSCFLFFVCFGFFVCLFVFFFQKLCAHMQVNKTKFERNSSLEYYHMTQCIGKTKHTS